MRTIAVVLCFVYIASCQRHTELSDTLAWMDNTYNPHEGVSQGSGHGRLYDVEGEDGSLETFTYDGCNVTIRHEPKTSAAREIYSTYIDTFSLRDINPRSIKNSTFDASTHFNCAALPGTNCSLARVEFSTHVEAPVIDEQQTQIFTKLQGIGHKWTGHTKLARDSFQVDDAKYADHFAKALRRAVELCGGKPEEEF